MKHTRRLPHQGNMVEKKRTQILSCICCMYEQHTCNRCRVVFVSFLLHYVSIVGQSSCVFSPSCVFLCVFPSFYRFIPISKDFYRNFLSLVHILITSVSMHHNSLFPSQKYFAWFEKDKSSYKTLRKYMKYENTRRTKISYLNIILVQKCSNKYLTMRIGIACALVHELILSKELTDHNPTLLRSDGQLVVNTLVSIYHIYPKKGWV